MPTGNDGKHDIVRLVDASAAAGLAVDSDPSLQWLADSNKDLDKIQLKVDLAIAVTADKPIDNPVLVEHASLGGGQSKVCVSGSIAGAAMAQPACVTLTTDKANNLVRWLHQVRSATTAAGVDPQRARLHLGAAGAQSIAELTFALKP